MKGYKPSTTYFIGRKFSNNSNHNLDLYFILHLPRNISFRFKFHKFLERQNKSLKKLGNIMASEFYHINYDGNVFILIFLHET